MTDREKILDSLKKTSFVDIIINYRLKIEESFHGDFKDELIKFLKKIFPMYEIVLKDIPYSTIAIKYIPTDIFRAKMKKQYNIHNLSFFTDTNNVDYLYKLIETKFESFNNISSMIITISHPYQSIFYKI